jgi:tol-pal system beta propeller repeat protein TolB
MLLLILMLLACAQEPVDSDAFESEFLVCFQSFRHGDFSSSIILASPDGSREVDLTPRAGSAKPMYLEPAFSPDEERIAYVAGGADGSHLTRVWVADAALEKPVLIPSQARRFSNEGRMVPAWSPDGTRLAYIENQGGRFEIFVVGIDGEKGRCLTPGEGKHARPQWSPDGVHILFDSDRDGDWDVYLMKADGTGVVQLTNAPAEDVFASWSPDAEHILFTSDRDGVSQLYVMTHDGKDVHPISRSGARAWNASWSPDGRHIAFVSDRNGFNSIWVMTVDGEHERQLSTSEFRDGRPTWVSRRVLAGAEGR